MAFLPSPTILTFAAFCGVAPLCKLKISALAGATAPAGRAAAPAIGMPTNKRSILRIWGLMHKNLPMRLRCAIVLKVEEDTCEAWTEEKVLSARFAPRFPSPRTERVSPGHLVAVATAPDGRDVIIWRWYDAVVLSDEGPDSLRLWEPGHGEVVARRRYPYIQYAPGTRAYLSAGLPGAEWWAAGPATSRAEAEVDLDEVDRLYTENALWDAAFAR